MRRLITTAALVCGLVVVPVAPAQASACTGASGVTVIVDFASLGGVSTGCASGPSTGLDALHQAGFPTEGVSNSAWFVCRISGLPPAAQEPCVNTPPATAYWSYWYAVRGGSWTYSNKGAGNRQPPPGSVEGWAFGAGQKPSVAPPATLPPPPPPPPPATTAKPGTTTKAAQDPVASVEPPPSESPPALSASAQPSISDSPTAAASVPVQRSNFTGVAVAIGLLLVLIAAAIIIRQQRRRSSE